MDQGGGGCDGVLRFYVKTFYLTLPRNFVVAPSVYQKFSGIGKFYGSGGVREYHDFTSILFCPTVSKSFVGESFSVSIVSGIEKS